MPRWGLQRGHSSQESAARLRDHRAIEARRWTAPIPSTRVSASQADLEGALAGNWTVKLEYLHVDLGSVDTTFATLPLCAGNFVPALGAACVNLAAGTATIRTRVTDEIVRVGSNYRFDPAPVVARN